MPLSEDVCDGLVQGQLSCSRPRQVGDVFTHGPRLRPPSQLPAGCAVGEGCPRQADAAPPAEVRGVGSLRPSSSGIIVSVTRIFFQETPQAARAPRLALRPRLLAVGCFPFNTWRRRSCVKLCAGAFGTAHRG